MKIMFLILLLPGVAVLCQAQDTSRYEYAIATPKMYKWEIFYEDSTGSFKIGNNLSLSQTLLKLLHYMSQQGYELVTTNNDLYYFIHPKRK